MDAELFAAVKEYAARFPVPALIAMIMQDSKGEPNFTRPVTTLADMWNSSLQVPFRTLSEHERNSVTAPADFPGSDIEWSGQRTAWGPLPIVGAVAREQGYVGTFPALCGPSGIRWACLRLNKLRDEYRLSVRETMSAWYSHDPALAEKVFLDLEKSGNRMFID